MTCDTCGGPTQWTLDIDDNVWVRCISPVCEGSQLDLELGDDPEWWDPSGEAGVLEVHEEGDQHSADDPTSNTDRLFDGLPF